MTGYIKTIRNSYGFILGEDEVSYFFMPSGLQRSSVQFDDLTAGQAVESFIAIVHPKGPRAIEIMIRESSSGNKDDKDKQHGVADHRWDLPQWDE